MIGAIIGFSSDGIIDTLFTVIPVLICVACITEIRERQTLQDRNYRMINKVLKSKKENLKEKIE